MKNPLLKGVLVRLWLGNWSYELRLYLLAVGFLYTYETHLNLIYHCDVAVSTVGADIRK